MPVLDPSTRRTLAELASILKNEPDASNVKNVVISRLQQLNRPCLTVGCDHGLKSANLCGAYSTGGEVYVVEGGELQAAPQTLTRLVQPFVCDIFQLLEDKSKADCRACAVHDYWLRGEFDGVFCHGCGLFIDFKNRHLGYVQEWTTRYSLTAEEKPAAAECKNCGYAVTNVKFGDYLFCSKECLEDWYYTNMQSVKKTAPA